MKQKILMSSNPTRNSAQVRLALDFVMKPGADATALPKTMGTFASFLFASAIAAMVLCSCASISTKSTWKSSDFKGGPVQKVAVLAVAERATVRTALENRFANQLKKDSQPAVTTLQMLSLLEIKENKEAAAARLREAGADSVLITRLTSKSTYDSQPRQAPNAYYSIITGSPSEGWHTYYTSAYSNVGAPRSDSRDYYLLDTSLFDLDTGKRLWSCITETKVRENADKLEIADALVARVVELMRKDGMVR
jgi:hypothetical protein